MKYFITAIDTNVGKTIVSAILAKALGYSYWKPVQCGDLENSDTINIGRLVKGIRVYEEAYRLEAPMSPHEAARLSGLEVILSEINIPNDNNLIIEGAGGIMVPLNYNSDLVIDIAVKANAEVILVFKNYLGSINHTLLSIDYLKRNNFSIKGLILIGERSESSEKIITKYSGCRILYHFPYTDDLDENYIKKEAEKVKRTWDERS